MNLYTAVIAPRTPLRSHSGRAQLRTVLLSALLACIVSACATHRPPIDLSPSWPQRLQALTTLNHWSFNGRLGIRAGEEGWSATLRWQQHDDRYDIHISAPLGQGTARLHGDTDHVIMELPDEPPLQAANAQTLLHDQLGWSVPVVGMRHWLAGHPDPQLRTDSMELDDLGRLSQFSQAGWNIQYRRYATVDRFDLPRKIELVNGDLRIRLVVDQWQLPEG